MAISRSTWNQTTATLLEKIFTLLWNLNIGIKTASELAAWNRWPLTAGKH
jgi:hypothetical protein